MYCVPKSDGSLTYKPGQEEGSIVINESFVIAITNSKVSDSLEMPLAALSVP